VENQNATWFPGSAGKKTKTRNRNFIVFAFFIVLSFIFWYLNSLEKDLETDIKYPVKYVNFPENKTLSDDLPPKLTLILNGRGYSILKLKISGKTSPLEIDYSGTGIKHERDSKSADYYIVTSGLVQKFSSQLKSDCKIVSVKPDTLFFPSGQSVK